MGRLMRLATATGVAAAFAVLGADAARAFDGFGETAAEATFGEGLVFEVAVEGGAPDRLELLLQTPGDDASFVVPVQVAGATGRHVWNTAVDHLTPNTPVTYRWRAIDGDETTTSAPATILYDDDRPELDWQEERLGDATVHWYGGAEAQARRFGELTAQGVARSEALLGTRLAGPVDVFVYETRDEFFGALGPGVREWTGAAAFSNIRTIFMWLGGGSTSYLEVAMLHEVAHIVFHDATDNPFHEPARWLNEGLATWSERSEADDEAALVALEAGGGGLFAFDAITEQFPIGERGGRLSYAQGAVLIDRIVDAHGEEAIAAIAAAYRDGASDAEALEAGTGVPADELYAAFYADFGVEVPQPIEPNPIGASTVERPPSGPVDQGGVDGGPGGPDEEPPDDGAPTEPDAGGSPGDGVVLVVLLAAAAVVAVALVVVVARRGARGTSG